MGKSEAQKKFDRKCDVFNAKKNDFLNKTFGLDIKFDKDLLNDEYAENHINGKTAPKKEDVKKSGSLLIDEEPAKEKTVYNEPAEEVVLDSKEALEAINKTIECLDRQFKISKSIDNSMALDGLDYISEMFNKETYKNPKTDEDKKVKEANDEIKRWLVKYGKDLREGNDSSELSKAFISNFWKTCHSIGDTVRLSGRLSKSEVLSEYRDAVKFGTSPMKALENPNYYKVSEQANADNVPENNIPKDNVPDGKKIPRGTDMTAHAISDVLDACILSDPNASKPSKKGAESLKKYFADASNFETELGKAVSDCIMGFWNKDPNNIATDEAKNTCRALCGTIGVDLLFEADAAPQTINKAVKAAAESIGIKAANTPIVSDESKITEKQKGGISLNIPQ